MLGSLPLPARPFSGQKRSGVIRKPENGPSKWKMILATRGFPLSSLVLKGWFPWVSIRCKCICNWAWLTIGDSTWPLASSFGLFPHPKNGVPYFETHPTGAADESKHSTRAALPAALFAAAPWLLWFFSLLWLWIDFAVPQVTHNDWWLF